MKNTPFFIFLLMPFLFSTFFPSCKTDAENEGLNDSLKLTLIDSTTVDTIPNDIVVDERIVSDTQILFFMPSPKERQEIQKFYGTYSQYEFLDMFNNFVALTNNVKRAMRTSNIEVEVTYAKKFTFPMQDDTLVYDLEFEGQMLGIILSDGVNYPLIKNGVQKTKDVSNDIRNYFNLSNFSIAGY